jgi:hypothetical protein
MRRLLALAVFTTLASSALARMPWSDKPAWSEVDGAPVAAATADMMGVTVLSIDRKSLNTPKEKVTLDPGKRALMLAGTRASSDGTVVVPYRFDAAPCVRYRLAGRQASPGDSRLEIVVVAQEAIVGCQAPVAANAGTDTTTAVAMPMTAAPAIASESGSAADAVVPTGTVAESVTEPAPIVAPAGSGDAANTPLR